MSEVDDYLNRSMFVAQSSTVGAMNDDPDQAAQALDLESETGVPAGQIYGDVDGFNRQYKAKMASQIISENRVVADWLASHPMAPRVAHDDLGALDATSRATEALTTQSPLQKFLASDPMHTSSLDIQAEQPKGSFAEGFGDAPIGSSAFQKPSDLDYALSNPALGALAATIATPMELISRTASGLIRLGHDNIAKVFGEGPANELAAMAEWAMTRGDIGVKSGGGGASGPLARIAENQKFLDSMRDAGAALDLSDPWTSIGREPPAGIHPLLDEAKKLQSKDDLDALDNALKEASQSATRERAPDLFADLLRSHLGDREIGVAPEAVRELYGERVPSRDDNILGWVPDLDKRLASAELTGEDVRIPMSDWLAKVDPDVAKQLHDDIRVRDDGITANEGKIEAEPKEVVNEPQAQVRGAAGLEPMFQVGDRKLTLQKRQVKDQYRYPEGGTDEYRIHDENGKKVGWLEVKPSADGTQLYVENVGGFESLGFGPNAFGPALTRSLLRQLKEIYPNMKEIGGFRISGAREKAGTTGAMTIKAEAGEAMDPRQTEYFKSLLTQNWEDMGRGLLGLFHEEGKGLAADSPMGQMVLSELRRIVPDAESDVAHRLKAPGGQVRGVFIPRLRQIIVSLESPDPIATARHESIHALRKMGLLSEDEWSTLEKASDEQSWMQHYNVAERWKNFPQANLKEESIAEAFRDWAQFSKDGRILRDFDPAVKRVFQKIKDFFEGLRKRIGEMLGHELSWEQIFEKIDSGEIGSRELPGEGDELGRQEPQFQPKDYGASIGADKERILGPAAKLGDKVYRGITHPMAAQEALKTIGKTIEDVDKVPELNAEGFITSKGRYLNREEALALGRETGQIPDNIADRIAKDSGQLDTTNLVEADAEAPKFQPADEGPGLYDRAKALGVTQSHMDRMLRLIDKRNSEDLQASQKRAELRQRRRSNKEYKERRTSLRDEVREDLESRPDVAIDQFIAQNKIKLHPDHLTEDQAARLPKDYIQKKEGINPDDLAPYFGYTSGEALVERLGMLTEDRRRSGMSARDYLNRLIDVETDRRLNREFGNREQNILDEAKDQALSETQLNLVHEETLAYALKAGQEPQFTKEQVRDMVRQVFNDTPIGQISSDRLLQTAGKIGKKIEEAGAKAKWDEAYRLSQQRNHAVIAAKLARDFEREKRSLDRTAKQFRKREVASVPAEYTNWIHDLLNRVGYGINRSIQDLQENIGRQGSKTLADFVTQKETEWMGMRELPIADFLTGPNFRKPIKELSYSDFMGLKNAIDALVKAGRDEKKIYLEGEAHDLDTTLREMRDKLSTFTYKPSKVEPSRVGKWPRAFIYGLTNMETLLNRWDRSDPRGIFNRLIATPLADAANGKARMQREIAKLYADLPEIKDLNKLVDSPITDPMSRDMHNPQGSGTWLGFNRGNVIQILMNAGNESNWKVLARGYGEDPVALFQWLQRNVSKEDIAFAEGLGKIFKTLIDRADNVYERMTGATIEKVKLKPIEFKLANGEVVKSNGWYHPLVADADRKTTWVQDPDTGLWSQKAGGKRDTLDNADFFHFTTSNGYTKKRTGAIYPLDLNFNSTPTRIRQMIHDIAFREVIHETQKVFSNAPFRENVSKYYGTEYAHGLMPYLRAVAGSEGIPSKALSAATSLSELMRQNVISTYIGFNPFTVLKHGPTAAVMSAREVGLRPFAKSMYNTFGHDIPFLEAVKSLFGQAPSVAKLTSDFVMKNSEEIQRRERHWQDTIAGQGKEIEGATTIRDKIIQAGSAAVAWSDMVSAKPTWLAAYNKALADGLSHGDAISLGDRAVRRAHGSTAETNQPPLVRGGGPLHSWLTSVYGFFGTAMQRRIETAHKLNDAWNLGREGEINKASKKLGSAFADFMTYMIWPTIVEEVVQGLGTDDHRTWGSRIISGATMGMASSVLYIRDLVHGLVSGHEPGVGLLSSASHDMYNALNAIGHPSKAFSRQHAAKSVGDLLTAAGEVTGMMPKIVGNTVRYGMSVKEGNEKPRSPADVLLGMTRGTQKRRQEK